MKSSLKNSVSQQGFTLIESLLTLFILTIGLLGVAGMQLEGIRSGDLAMQRTAVVIKAQEMMERVRAASGDDDDLRLLNAYLDVFDATSAADHQCNISGTVCDPPSKVAEHDVFMWQRSLEQLVPVLTASTVTRDGTNITVSIGWQDRGVDQSYSITSLISYSNY